MNTKKLISIIVPHYKETPEQIFPLLSSLNNQIGVKWSEIECILITDGNGIIIEDNYLKLFYNLDIKNLILDKNVGSGLTRQAGLDIATGEYIMFCDADDILHNVGVLNGFLVETQEHKHNLISTSWLEEIYDAKYDRCLYNRHDGSDTWLHGKLFRRQFLEDNKVRFHEELRLYEDIFFIGLAYAMEKNKNNIKFSPYTSYIWRWNQNSITRTNNCSVEYETALTCIHANDLLVQRLKQEKDIAALESKVVGFIIGFYFKFHLGYWQTPEKASYLQTAEKTLAKTIKDYMQIFESAPEDLINQYQNEFNNATPLPVGTENLTKWLNRIMTSYC